MINRLKLKMFSSKRWTFFLTLCLLGLFQGIKGDRAKFEAKWKEAPDPKDCNSTFTDLSLEFLSMDDLKNVSKDKLKELKGKGMNLDDCSLRRTDLDKLRVYLDKQGFLADRRNSLEFINTQDKVIKLRCGEELEYTWSLIGLKANDFNDKDHKGKKLTAESPSDYEYFRKYTCTYKHCSHTFFVITRPQAKLSFPLQHLEGDKNIKIDCVVNKCLYEDCAEGKTDSNPNSQAPYEFSWSVPETLKKLVNSDDITKSEYKCQTREDEDEEKKPQFQYYITKEFKKNGVEMKMKTKKNIKEGENPPAGHPPNKVPSHTESDILIDEGKKEHKGIYECIVTDKNGVPSTPEIKSLVHTVRYTGRGVLHVRALIWIIIPAALIPGIIILVLAINFLCPVKMEDDDGQPYKPDEVNPETKADSEPPAEDAANSKPPSAKASAVSKTK